MNALGWVGVGIGVVVAWFILDLVWCLTFNRCLVPGMKCDTCKQGEKCRFKEI